MSQDRMSWWQGLIGLRGAAGETTTRETSRVSLETKVGIQLSQGLVLAFIAVPGTALGAWMTLTGLTDLLDLELNGLDLLLAVVLLSLAALAVRPVMAEFAARSASSSQVKMLFSGVMTALLLGVVVYVWVNGHRQPSFGTSMAVLFGPGILYGLSLLTYNLTMHLREPFGFESPFERRYLDLYERERFGTEPEPVKRVLEVRTENGAYVTDSDALGLDEDKLIRFARELINANWDLTESRWGSFSQVFASYTEYRATRSVMESNGLIRKVNPKAANSPYEMTRGGKAAFNTIAGVLT